MIAWREYLAAVRTKGFIIGVILMPLLMGGGLILQRLTQNIVDLSPRRCAVIDRTPGEVLLPMLRAAADRYNAAEAVDPQTHKRLKPPFQFDRVAPPDDAASLDATRLAAADEIQSGRAVACLEIGPDALKPASTQPAAAAQAAARQSATEDDESKIFYSTNRPTYADLRDFIQQTLQTRVTAARLGQSPELIASITRLGPVVVSRGMPSRDPAGRLTFQSRQNELAQVFLPLVMVVVMLVVVLVGASPLTTNIIEEKQLRIAEVLLGSVTPFQLMMGKLVGGVATSLSLGAIYVLGAVAGAWQMGVLHLIPVTMVIWFVIFTVIASLMYGSLFVVAGAAATNVKEAQALVSPLMLVVVLPMFLVGPLLNEPHGIVGITATFFPTSAPIVTMMRLAIPPSIPWWQPAGAIVSSSLLTALLVWVAGRVFRAGFLLTGRPASIKEIFGWLIRG